MPVVDLCFRLVGTSVPADHGYLLYRGLCGILQGLHAPSGGGSEGDKAANASHDLWRVVGVHPINGRLIGGRRLGLTPTSRLSFRLPSERIGDLLPLAGQRLAIGSESVQVGVPEVFSLKPVPALYSRLVTIKGFQEPDGFLDAVRRQLATLGVQGEAGLVRRRGARSLEGTSETEGRSPFIRRTIRIRDKEVVGFAVIVSRLTAEESIRLQETGVGGRRRFGCGVFVPSR